MIDPKKVFLAVCLNGFTAPAFIQCLLAVTKNLEFGEVGLHPGGISVFHARDALTAEFLKSGCSHLLFIDSDIVFSPAQVTRLLGHSVEIVGGIYPIKSDGPLRVAIDDYHIPRPTLPSGLQSVRHVATGFMLIARSVFEKIIAADGPEIEFQNDFPPHEKIYHFWQLRICQDKDRRRLLTEDWFFCHRWLELGGEVFVDREIFLRHYGNVMFPLQSQIKPRL